MLKIYYPKDIYVIHNKKYLCHPLILYLLLRFVFLSLWKLTCASLRDIDKYITGDNLTVIRSNYLIVCQATQILHCKTHFMFIGSWWHVGERTIIK